MTEAGPERYAYDVEPRYLKTRSGRIFVLYLVPRTEATPRTLVMALPPFAEEMNKSRRMISLLGHQLAGEGAVFVCPDLHGTGDSEGEFGEVDWEAWISNIRLVSDAAVEFGVHSVCVLALRSGVFLLPGVSHSRLGPGLERIVLWNPVQSGSKMIDQFLRSKVIRDRTSAEPVSVANIRRQVEGAGGVEVAGYWLSEALLRSIDGLSLADFEPPGGVDVLWIDVSPVRSETTPPAVGKVEAAWRGVIGSLDYAREVGPQFWMGPEIELLPGIVDRSRRFLLASL